MPIPFIQSWYQRQSNGYWEHSFGITIETLDTPGWMVTIDLTETPLEKQIMESVRRERSAKDWLICEVVEKQYRGQGDPHKLLEILKVFQEWASRTG